MAIAFRETLALATLALTASLLPAAGAQAATASSPAVRIPSIYCLANAWDTPNISTKPCNSADRGQDRVTFNDQISLALA
ncbi:hypothetical protein [Streptomyces sp. NPDC048357]|uniref:hypothetical protein n=1 Tax=Streptomyces sp. NPDC048357 TaxID=3154719 RepID=UPI0034342523